MRTGLIVFVILLCGFKANGNMLAPVETSRMSRVSFRFVQEDSLQALQYLYRGTTWTNKFRRIKGDQFFLGTYFIPATISANGHIYSKLRIKYDIYSDEILIPLSIDEIIMVNKEMVDSFNLLHENKIYRFINTDNDSAGGPGGYCQIIYNSHSRIYIKHIKNLNTSVSDESDGEFSQKSGIFICTNGRCFQVRNRKDMIRNLEEHSTEVRNFIREERIKLSRKDPGSFSQVLKYYDSLK